MRKLVIALLAVVIIFGNCVVSTADDKETVVLLHGIARVMSG